MLFPKPGPKKTPRLHVRKGDKVVVISGQYKSDEPHEVLKVLAETGKVIVQGVNMRWKHQKRSQQNPKGGRVQMEMPIPASKVLLFSEKLGRGTRTRIERQDGHPIRVGVKCGTRFDQPGKAAKAGAEGTGKEAR
ncbi:MAG: 50S ribosomal protein L24 [Planctomycetota bacterium]